jgi:hypothetical protein
MACASATAERDIWVSLAKSMISRLRKERASLRQGFP